MLHGSLKATLDSSGYVRIRVGYYNKDEERKLGTYPTAAKIAKLVQQGLRVPVAQFLTYYLFYRKRPGVQGLDGRDSLANRLDLALADLDGWVQYRGESLAIAPGVAPLDKSVTERVGEACALCVASEIHSLHEADWHKIPEYGYGDRQKVFDYQIDCPTGSDGEIILQVEAKGSAVEDTSRKPSQISNQKARIDEKKEGIAGLEASGDYCFPADLRYGSVAAIGQTGSLQCWLTDPPSTPGADAKRYKLLSRLTYINSWLKLLSGRSQLASAMQTRLNALCALGDPFELANVPLLRGNGEKFYLPPFASSQGSQGVYASLCRVSDGPAVGTLVGSPESKLYFVGVQRKLYELAVNQDFDSVLSYRNEPGSMRKTVKCVLPKGRARKMGLDKLPEIVIDRGQYIEFRAAGTLAYGSGCTVFGEVQVS